MEFAPSSPPVRPESTARVAIKGKRLGAPRLLVGIASMVGLAMLLPLAYLVLRTLELGPAQIVETIFSARMLQVTWNSVLLAALVTMISLLISVPLAWLTVRTDLPWRGMWSIVLTLPLVIPTYVGAYALVSMMGPRGILQGWLEPLGVQRLPSIYGLPGAVWALTIFSYPYLFLSLRAGLYNLDPALEEAARSLGLGPWRTFWRVILPALRPALVSGVLLLSLYVLSDFGAVSLVRYNSFTRAIYIAYQGSLDRSQAALLSLVLVALTILLLVGARTIQGRHRYHRTGSGAARRQRPIKLGAWRWPALLLCVAVAGASLVFPIGVIVYWLVRGLGSGEMVASVWVEVVNSVYVSFLAAGVAVLGAIPVAYYAVRYPSTYSGWVGRAAYLGYALPGIVIALSLVFFGANYIPILYQTLAMLIFGYTVRFLPQALAMLRTGLLQISPRLEEAARSLGLNRRRTLGRVTLPLLRPGIWAGAALVFLTTIKELPVTLLLSPTGFTTLAVEIWSATSEAFYARAAVPALLLVAVSALSIFIILGQEERAQL
ncbi:MAG: iron ABC transporter permease [Anaerolineales bacterium]|nr:iron ABC transporter permease [Anaerolineales bacterium]